MTAAAASNASASSSLARDLDAALSFLPFPRGFASLSESLSESDGSSPRVPRAEMSPPRSAMVARSAARWAVAGRGAARGFSFSAKALFLEKRPPPVSFLPMTPSKMPMVVGARVGGCGAPEGRRAICTGWRITLVSTDDEKLCEVGRLSASCALGCSCPLDRVPPRGTRRRAATTSRGMFAVAIDAC